MFTETDFQKLMDSVQAAFSEELAKAEEMISAPAVVAENVEVLVKAEENKEEKPEEKKEEAKPEDKKEEAPAEKQAAPEDNKEEAAPEAKQEEGKEAAPAEAKEEAAAPAAAAHEDCDYDEEDHAHMNSMYSSMSKGELRAHHDAIKNALDAQGMQKCGDMTMAKSETETVVEVPAEVVVNTQEVTLLKSELDAEKAKSEELKKSLDAVSEFLTKLVKKTAPQGKAITSMEVITKSEEIVEEKSLTKSEIGAILTKKAADPTLSKSDRELINAYYLNGASTNTISHLLK